MRTANLVRMIVVSASALAACGTAPKEDAEAASQAASAPPMITFAANWTDTASGELVAGQTIDIAYDPARLASVCGGSATSPGGGGGFAWGITGYYLVGSGSPVTFQVTITGAWASGNAVITPALSGPLQMWFGCSNTTGNPGWDSNYGANYRFTVAPPPIVDAGGDGAPTTGIVVVQVVGDSVSGSAGSVPPDSIVSTPISGASVFDGPFEAGKLLCTTGADGRCTATMTLGAHELDVFEETSDESGIYSTANPITVTNAPGTLMIHVVPNSVEVETSYNVGVGNAIYVTGETSGLGSWQTAYKAYFNSTINGWTFQQNIPMGAQFKLILAPWVAGTSISVTSPGVVWQKGANEVVTATTGGPVVNVEVYPSF